MNRYTAFAILLCGVVGTLASPVDVTAQEDNPLDFRGVSNRLGLEIGFTSVYQAGEYSAGCEVFDRGAGVNFLIAAAWDRSMGSSFRFESLLGFQGKSIASRFNSREVVGLATETGPVNAEVDFENIGRANFSYLFVQPGVKYYPFRNLYAGAGASVNFLLSGTTQYQKDILSRTIELNELGLSEVFYSDAESSDPYSMVYAEEGRDDAAGVTFDAVLMIGGEFYVGKTTSNPIDMTEKKKLALGPRLQYTIPFVNALSDGDHAMKLGSFQFLVGLRYEL